MPIPAPASPVYRKTKSGDFVVFGPADQIAGPGPITVHLKSGATTQTRILSVGAIFDVEGVSCRYGYKTAATPESAVRALQGTGKPSSQHAASPDLDAASFMPDSAYVSEEGMPAHHEEHEQFSGEFTSPANYDTTQFTSQP